MTEMQKTMAKAELAAKTADKHYLLTKSGVMILGDQLLGTKMTGILCELIKYYENSQVALVSINSDNTPIDGEGEAIFGAAYADAKSIAINLERCWQEAVNMTKEGNTALGFMGILWTNLIHAMAHELQHLRQAAADREEYELTRMEDADSLEDEARDAANMALMDLALKFDIEWPAIEALGYFSTKFMALFTGEEKDDDWVIGVRSMLADDIVYDNGKERCYTFRDFIKRAYEGADGEDWEQGISAVNIEAHLENGETELLKALPVTEPVIDAVDPEPEEAPAPDATVAQTLTFITNDAGEGMVIEDEEPAPAAETVASVEFTVPPLPPPVLTPAAQTQADAYAAHAATSTPKPAPPVETAYTPINMAPETQTACMKAVWQSVYAHIFSKCGWMMDPSTGRFRFTKASAVLDGVDISRAIAHFGADGFIQSMDTHNAEGQYAAEEFKGVIRGKLTSKQGLPSYDIYLNLGGHAFKRTFMPQNPESKKADGSYTEAADTAATGKRSAWVFKGEAPRGGTFMEKIAVKIHENDYQAVIDGKLVSC